ncbi:acyl-CoA carboxylase subunit beta [Patulibacter americanus]|uniref:acyl-CoA carboxylase subunit beta n=1 Tax=Patulibacter americanus TaxID=588672 RepID=UPI0003B3CE05|nr:carboxyl transferase domain-containing protein [Patulibacter americanus]
MTPRTASGSRPSQAVSAVAHPPTLPAEGGALTPLQRLETLCDPGSLRLLRTAVISPALGDRAQAGDGILAGVGTVGGRPVACYSEDQALLGGSLGARHAETLVRLLQMAGDAGMPVVGFLASAGARLQEGLEALAGYGRIFAELTRLSGQVPLISVVCGTCAGGGAYTPALTDVTIMTRDAKMFLTGPGVVRDVTGEDVSAADLGGPDVQKKNGVCQLVADDDDDAVRITRELLGYLPQRSGEEAPRARPVPAPAFDPSAHVPSEQRRPYDVRDVARAVVDGGRILELSPDWAASVVTALARIDGRTVGIVANQPKVMAGTLDAESAQKAARFVRWCHLFGVPLAVLVDTPGFMPGSDQEAGAVIRHGAKLVHAFAEADVLKVTVVLRKAFGGAQIAMNSRALGATLVLAWPTALIGVMGAEQAVGITGRRAIAAADDPAAKKAELAAEYAAEHLSAEGAAALGIVDEVIDPAATRDRLVWALTSLRRPSQREHRARNFPL